MGRPTKLTTITTQAILDVIGEVANDTVVLGPHLIRVGLGEYGAHHGGDHRPGAFRHLGQ